MDPLSNMPAWAGSAIAAMVLAALTFLGRSVHSWMKGRTAERNERRARLQELDVLLQTGRAIFEKQWDMAAALKEEVLVESRTKLSNESGLEEVLRSRARTSSTDSSLNEPV